MSEDIQTPVQQATIQQKAYITEQLQNRGIRIYISVLDHHRDWLTPFAKTRLEQLAEQGVPPEEKPLAQAMADYFGLNFRF
ncbi:hypothetical protein KY319_05325 [Candidatus Woesearchaeota archaeon]|nr:hypothetical protein [Candidatus Woesearchaeota archaeon]